MQTLLSVLFSQIPSKHYMYYVYYSCLIMLYFWWFSMYFFFGHTLNGKSGLSRKLFFFLLSPFLFNQRLSMHNKKTHRNVSDVLRLYLHQSYLVLRRKIQNIYLLYYWLWKLDKNMKSDRVFQIHITIFPTSIY